MSSAQSTEKHTSTEQVCRFLEELDRAKQRYAETSIHQRISLAERCAEEVEKVASEWVDLACRAKAIPLGSPQRAEEVFAGPVAALRHLRLLVHSLRGIEATGMPRLPGKAYLGPEGRLRVPLLPTGVLYDRIALLPFQVTAWMRAEIRRENLNDYLAPHYRMAGPRRAKTVAVLGAGNVSAIPLTDAFTKLFQEGGVVLLKMSPVNDYLGPVFERVLKPLTDGGYLRIIFGGADVGAAAVQHRLVDEVHITGSLPAHDCIVWGPPGAERDQRLSANMPLLEKPITSELGNVSPWIFLPGEYSRRQLSFQAENVAASVVNNVSFNCAATKVLLTWKRWPLRSQFLDLIDAVFARTPKRLSYYPGAVQRYRRFAEVDPATELTEFLPWTLLRDVTPDEKPKFFDEESFVCVLVEVPLDAPTPESFFRSAVDFANERLAGTLCAAVTHPAGFRSQASNERLLQTCLGELRYGAVAINHWPGLMYAMMSPPWGGFPGSSLADAQSGIAAVHNTFMLQGIEKAVLEGPLTMFPKPPWFPSHSQAERVAWSYFRLYHRPSWTNAVKLLWASLQG
ncbi:MAG: aldehyde dehydrogenase [Planctomycetota bacterium]|nr:aldehyde dehydrogenase [Planctomycetota bacterium]